MSISEKLTTIAENEQKVYDAGVEAGKKSEYDRFWDAYQENGERIDYNRAFCGTAWTEAIFKPKYNMQPTVADFMFYGFAENLKTILDERNISLDFSKVKVFQQIFQHCKSPQLPIIDMTSATSASYTFYSCRTKEIEKIIVAETTPYGTSFISYCPYLEKVTFEGIIGQNGFNISGSTKLESDSLLSILNCLKDYSEDTSGTTWAVTLGETLLNNLTDEEKAIATEKGWTLA